MSDVIGLAASIAGLAGFSGQLLEGCLFLKGFLDDLKHASSDIKYLATEIQLIQSITREISSKAQQVAQSVTWKVQEKDDCETAFRLCTESIKDLGQDIAKHSQRIEGKGSKRWWASLKAAIGKKALTEKLNRIERAKQKILMVQNSLSLHLEQDTCKQVINTSNVINTTLSQLQNEQNASFELIQEMNDYASQTYYGVSDMAKRMERIESGLQSLAPAILQGFLKGAVASAVEQHHLQLADHQDANIPAAMNSISTHPEPSGRRQRFERKHVILWTEYNFLLLKVAVETTKRWPILLDQTSEEDRSGGPQIETTYYILTNFPFWKRYIRINSAGNVSSLLSPGADLRMEVTTHGVFSDNSPIYKAVMNCDVDEVRTLLDQGKARPDDLHFRDGESLLEIFMDFILQNSSMTHIKFYSPARLLEILKLLLPCNKDSVEFLFLWRLIYGKAWKEFPESLQSIFAEAFRIILQAHDMEHYIENLYMLQLSDMKLPIVPVLEGNALWALEMKRASINHDSKFFVENDRQMLHDPSGIVLKKYILQNYTYQVQLRGSPFHQAEQSIHELLYLSLLHRNRLDIRECCKNRIAILVEIHYCDPHACAIWERPPQVDRAWQEESSGIECSTAFEFARSCGMEELLNSALSQAGWSASRVQDAHWKDYYAGIAQCLDSSLIYQTRDAFRHEFMLQLISGGFGIEQFDQQSLEELCINLGLPWYTCFMLLYMIESALTELEHRRVPGNWPETERKVVLPGIDFPLLDQDGKYPNGTPREQIIDWPCVREILYNAGIESVAEVNPEETKSMMSYIVTTWL